MIFDIRRRRLCRYGLGMGIGIGLGQSFDVFGYI
jgi:hypothetical protein